MPFSRERRKIVLAVAQAAAAALLAGANGAVAGTVTRALLDLPELSPDPDGPPSFDAFVRLSRLVTCRTELDAGVAKQMFAVFEDEPWAAKHIAMSYLTLARLLREGPPDVTVPGLLRSGALGDGERWFVSHLLTTWYLGVYYHPERPTVRVTYEGALAHNVLADYRPVPGLSDRDTGFWATKPETED